MLPSNSWVPGDYFFSVAGALCCRIPVSHFKLTLCQRNICISQRRTILIKHRRPDFNGLFKEGQGELRVMEHCPGAPFEKSRRSFGFREIVVFGGGACSVTQRTSYADRRVRVPLRQSYFGKKQA